MTPVAERTVARNDPCPCGSGRRYKDCHGSLRAPAQPSSPRPRTYRPDGDDWASLGEDDRERLGTMMEAALTEQRAGRVREAERLYRAVLEQAPNTHDALHMLGVVRLGVGDLAEAERLITQAMKSRPEYEAIVTNWSLVRRTIAARDRGGVEIVCEHALPLLFETLREARACRVVATASAAQALHLITPSIDTTGRARPRMRTLAAWLAPLGAKCWNAPVDESSWQRIERLQIDRATGVRPRSGCALLVGVEGDAHACLDGVERVLVFVQPAAPSVLLEGLRHIAGDGSRDITLVVDSQARARRLGTGHVVLPPMIGHWQPAPMHARHDALRVCMVGQHRERVVAVDDRERQFVTALAARGAPLDIYDPGPLRYDVGADPRVTCIARDDAVLQATLAAGDVFLHRPGPWWAEDAALMLAAMVVGRAVLCPRASVYAEYVVDGVDGFLYDDDDHALAIIERLRADRSAVVSAGEAARAHAEQRFDSLALESAYREAISRWTRP